MIHEQVEEVAREAAKLYGQEWDTLSHYSKDIWRESARHADPPEIITGVQRCVAEARKALLEASAPQPAEEKTKKKRGKD